MALTVQVCKTCKHEQAARSPVLDLGAMKLQIMCPCACHGRYKPW